MTRTRWIVLCLGLSFASNVFLAAALWRKTFSITGAEPATETPVYTCCAEERALRERLETQLCAQPPDYTAVEATFASLDSVRAKERRAALAQLMAQGRDSICRNNQLSPEVGRILCPWRYDPKAGCSPSETRSSRPRSPPA